jgi:hypothetical protein
MSLSDLASLGSFVSGIAVLLSLVFLYFQFRQVNLQVKQTEKNQQALIRQNRATRSVDLNMRRAEGSLVDVAQCPSGFSSLISPAFTSANRSSAMSFQFAAI